MNTATTEEKEVFTTSFDDQPFVLHQFEKPGEVALYYGFVPIQSPTLSQKDWKCSKSIVETTITSMRNIPGTKPRKEYEIGLRPEELCAFFRKYLDEGIDTLGQPLGVYYTLPLQGDTRSKIRGQLHRLDIINSRQPIADATILKTALVILAEEGHSDATVFINSMGDDQSKTRYRRELIEYFKAHINELPKRAQSLIKDNVFTLLHYDDEEVNALVAGAPNPLDFLDEESRTRFMDVLEFLETLGIAYTIDPTLIGDVYSEHTIFEIRKPSTQDKGELLARGGCYAHIAKKAGASHDLPSVGITLAYTRAQKIPRSKFTLTRINRPVCYFMQLGPAAKLKSLHVIEHLRQACVPIRHALCKDKCFGQMAVAKQTDLPYLIIMGQKEALENCVVIRNVNSYSQETVPIENLPTYMKKIAKKTT